MRNNVCKKKMKKNTLSKSSFIRGLQCSKSLYLYKHFYSLRDKLSPETQSKFSRGHHVGLLAQQLFPDGVNLKPFSPIQFANSVNKTKENILKGTNTIYEAAFSYNDVTVFLDILHFENGGWHAYEVKSSADVSETFIMDASLQYYVITNSGIDLASFQIVYINKDYVRQDKIDLKNFFNVKDVTAVAKQNLDFVHAKVEEYKAMLEKKEVPLIGIGMHCNNPYSCDFQGHCRKEIPKNKTVFSIPAFNAEEQYALHDKGIILIENIPPDYKLNDIQKLQIACSHKNEEYFDVAGLKKYFSGIRYPVLFADLLSCRSAVPLQRNKKPYQLLPFMMHALLAGEDGREINSFSFFHEDVTGNKADFFGQISTAFDMAETIVVADKAYFIQSLQTFISDGLLTQKQFEIFENKIIGTENIFSGNLYFNPVLPAGPGLQNIARSIFKIRISRELLSSHVIASDMYETMQSETDMFHIVEIKEKFNEFAAFNLDVLKRFFDFLLARTRS
jgi:hypothetical protein